MDKIIEARHIKKYFDTPAGKLHAVDDISFCLERGKTLGVVGESGCGKSTLGRTILGLTDATEGQIVFNGRDVTHLRGAERKKLCRNMQMIFQDPYSSLNPRLCTFELIAEPLNIFHVYKDCSDLTEHVNELMDTVGIPKQMTYLYPHELDGGRRQRIGIARALALNPEFIVCDEPVSALDVSIQAQVLNLLKQLQRDKRLTYIFITHNLSVVKHISDDILVMYVGQEVEKAPSSELFKRPLHPYTKGLLSAIPIPRIGDKKRRILMHGEISSPVNPAPGCRFAPRCPYAKERCFSQQPELREPLPKHFVACHFAESIDSL